MVAFTSPFSFLVFLGISLLSFGSAAPVDSGTDDSGASKPLAHYNLRVLTLGDSITYGFQSTDGNGYRQTLYQDLIHDNAVNMIGSLRAGTMRDPDNEGHSGYRIGQIAAVQGTHTSLGQHPNIVLLHAGTNDAVQDFDTAAAPNRLGDLMDEILSADEATTLIVAQIIASKNATIQQRIEAFNAKVPALVTQRVSKGHHVQLVDMSHLLDLNTQMADNVHPNDAGYKIMGNAWYHALEQANGKGWIKNVPVS